MPNPKHIEWLHGGVEVWNERRKQKPFRPDLAGVVFSEELEDLKNSAGNIDLSGINLEDANLSMADLSHIYLRDSILAKANLQGANLFCAKLERANCYEADFADANLWGAKLDCVEFFGASLKKAVLDHCDMPEASLCGTDLTGTSLAATELWRAKIFFNKRDQGHRLENNTRKISSVGGFLKVFKAIKTSYTNRRQDLSGIEKYFPFDPEEEPIFYFRGHRRKSWDLRPSVMRDRKLRDAERDMLLDIMTQQPSAFKGLDSALAELVLAQHHGLKTRFLDVTRNPLVALFYACHDVDHNGQGTEDAHMHIFAAQRPLIKTFRSDAISVIANFAKLSQVEQSILLGKRGQGGREESGEYLEIMERLYYLIHREKPYFHERIDPRDFFKVFVIEPQQSFDRIRIQSSAFLISGFHEQFDRKTILQRVPGTLVYDHYVLTVPHIRKKSILDELRLLNIKRETLFPGLDETARAITQQCSS